MNGVVESLASLSWVVVLAFLLLYSASLVFRCLVGEGYIYDHPDDMPEEALELFGTVWRSFLALFKLMNDDQSVVAPIITTVTGQILFYMFMMLSNWMMLAILTSVISDNMMQASRAKDELDRQKEARETHKAAQKRLKVIFHRLDEDSDGSISEEEMLQTPKRSGSAGGAPCSFWPGHGGLVRDAVLHRIPNLLEREGDLVPPVPDDVGRCGGACEGAFHPQALRRPEIHGVSLGEAIECSTPTPQSPPSRD